MHMPITAASSGHNKEPGMAFAVLIIIRIKKGAAIQLLMRTWHSIWMRRSARGSKNVQETMVARLYRVDSWKCIDHGARCHAAHL